jgi:phosphopantetheine--protein transferase-like protein
MKIGVDIISVERIKKLLLNKRAKERVFTVDEMKDLGDNAMRLAGRWAAKEAYFKASGQKCDWLEIEILNKKNGEPYFSKPENIKNISLSISHESEYAVAMVIIK